MSRRGEAAQVYGKDFADVYGRAWFNYSRMVWPFISHVVRKRTPQAHTWLDLCCGTGRLLELLEGTGIAATGLDVSRHQLAIARRNAPSARLVRADVRSFRLGRRFDVVTCLFDSLNYLTTKGDLAQALSNVRRHLSPGGIFVFDVNTFEGLEDGWRTATVKRDKGYFVVVEPSFDDRTALGRAHITGFVKEGRATGDLKRSTSSADTTRARSPRFWNGPASHSRHTTAARSAGRERDLTGCSMSAGHSPAASSC